MTKSKQSKNNANAQAVAILTDACREFPGLLDGETEVNGSDLINYLTTCIDYADALKVSLQRRKPT